MKEMLIKVMKTYGSCPKCCYDDRVISLLPDNEDGVYGFTCLKCGYEELHVLEYDDDCDIWEIYG